MRQSAFFNCVGLFKSAFLGGGGFFKKLTKIFLKTAFLDMSVIF